MARHKRTVVIYDGPAGTGSSREQHLCLYQELVMLLSPTIPVERETVMMDLNVSNTKLNSLIDYARGKGFTIRGRHGLSLSLTPAAYRRAQKAFQI